MIFDVLVSGAGVAGSAAAIRAARKGLTVAIAEAMPFPRHRPGEALDPSVEPLFRKLGIQDLVAQCGFLRNPGVMYCRGRRRTILPFTGRRGLEFGFQVWRADFDALLLSRAASLGVKVFQPAGVRAFEPCARGYAAMVGKERVTFRHLVEASGANSWLRREVRIPLIRVSPQLIARFAYRTSDLSFGALPEFHEYDCGMTWIAKVRPDCFQAVRLSLDSSTLPPAPRPFDETTRWRGADVTWRFVPACAGDGYFICGDAASVLDPAATSRAVRAMESGIRAADLIADIERGRMSRGQAVLAWRRHTVSSFLRQVRRLAASYQAFRRPPEWIRAVAPRLVALRRECDVDLKEFQSSC